MNERYDLVLEGGTVIDGTRAPRFEADVGVSGGRIVAIAEPGALRGHAAQHRIAVHGLIVGPGFIDAHTHDDLALLRRPGMDFKVSQGVTTVVTGNCGISPAPLQADTPMPAPLTLAAGGSAGRYASFGAYLDALRHAPAAVNVAALLGHTTLRARCVADLGRAANAAEIEAMRARRWRPAPSAFPPAPTTRRRRRPAPRRSSRSAARWPSLPTGARSTPRTCATSMTRCCNRWRKLSASAAS